MCVICQNGPALLGGVPFTGLALARIRRALTPGGAQPDPHVTSAEAGPEDAR